MLKVAVREGQFRRRGDFFWSAAEACPVRLRSGTRIPAERIAPEEYRAATCLVLAEGHGFSRAQLLVEVRSVLGYSRLGPALEGAILGVVDSLIADGVVGEGSAGIRMRKHAH